MEIIEKAIQKNKKIRIIAYSVSETIEERLQSILEFILTRYECITLLSSIYTCVKELLINAVKANFKHIYFEGYTPQNEADKYIDYELSLKLFKLELSRENAAYFEELARRSDIKAQIDISISDDTLFLDITNPVTMTEREYNNVQRKLEDARSCSDISEYFMKVEDDPEKEGAGLGLVLVSIMMKNIGIPEENFTIQSLDNHTTARLVIPLTMANMKVAL